MGFDYDLGIVLTDVQKYFLAIILTLQGGTGLIQKDYKKQCTTTKASIFMTKKNGVFLPKYIK